MVIPDESHPGWAKALSGRQGHDFELLATQILLSRLTHACQKNPSPETTRKCAAELRTFFERNIHLPKAQADLRKILG